MTVPFAVELPNVDIANILTGGFSGALLVYVIKFWIPDMTNRFERQLNAERAQKGMLIALVFEMAQAKAITPELKEKAVDTLKKSGEDLLAASVLAPGKAP